MSTAANLTITPDPRLVAAPEALEIGRPVYRKHKWALGPMENDANFRPQQLGQCLLCGLQAWRVPTRTGKTLVLEVLEDGAIEWQRKVYPCPGSQEREEQEQPSGDLDSGHSDGFPEIAPDSRTPEQNLADLQQLNHVLNDEVVKLRGVRDGLFQELVQAEARALPRQRKRMPKTRPSITHDFEVGGLPGYLTIGLRNDGSMGEFFLTLSKQGSTLDGFADSFARCASLALQWGMPLESLVEKFRGYSFEPSGCTDNPEIPMAKSVVDYVVRYLERRFRGVDEQAGMGNQLDLIPAEDVAPVAPRVRMATPGLSLSQQSRLVVQQGKQGQPIPARKVATGPPCPECGTLMVPAGKCHCCPQCGTTNGCS